jgi:hypothetical protein
LTNRKIKSRTQAELREEYPNGPTEQNRFRQASIVIYIRETTMGIFGNDKEQDARIDALESHVRAISEAIQQTQLDVMKVNISLIRTESMLGDKVSSADVDPGIVALNEQLGVAREEYEKMSAAAEDKWTTLHAGASDALATLRSSVEEAAARAQQEMRD